MSELIILSLGALFCMTSSGFMFGNLLSRKMLEIYDIRNASKGFDEDLCCCGAMIDDHSFSDNHGFVSIVDHYIKDVKSWPRGSF